MKLFKISIIIVVNLLILNFSVFAQKRSPILQDKINKTVTFSDISGSLTVRLNYSGGCTLDKIIVKGIEVTGSGNAVFSGIRSGDQLFTSKQCVASPVITITDNSVKCRSHKIWQCCICH